MHLAGFIEALSKSASWEEVFGLVCRTAALLGYEKVGLFALSPEAQQAAAVASGEVTPIVISNYTHAFTCAYQQGKRYEIDPVLPLARDTITPLVWEDVLAQKELSEEQTALVSERREAGIHDEITCPIHGPRGQTFALRFARGCQEPCDRAHLSTLQVMAIHFYYAFIKFMCADVATKNSPAVLSDTGQKELPSICVLSQREQEVLLWTARGKSASSISVILELSENTVNFYVKNAMRKLGTTNRVVAVVLAVRSGLIQP